MSVFCCFLVFLVFLVFSLGVSVWGFVVFRVAFFAVFCCFLVFFGVFLCCAVFVFFLGVLPGLVFGFSGFGRFCPFFALFCTFSLFFVFFRVFHWPGLVHFLLFCVLRLCFGSLCRVRVSGKLFAFFALFFGFFGFSVFVFFGGGFDVWFFLCFRGCFCVPGPMECVGVGGVGRKGPREGPREGSQRSLPTFLPKVPFWGFCDFERRGMRF